MKKRYIVGLLVGFVCGACQLLGVPTWWTEYSLTDSSAREDDAIATIGQAKHAVQKAFLYLEDELAPVGGAGLPVTNIYNTYCAAAPENPLNDASALTLGQLKYLAKLFYDRLNSVTVAWDTTSMNPASVDIYPWTVDQQDDADFSLATIGQLKFVFSFDLESWTPPGDLANSDGDELPDIWEQQIIDADLNDSITSLLEVLPNDDFDGDSLSNLQEFQLGTDPTSSSSNDGDAIPDDWELFYGLNTTPGGDSSVDDVEPDGLSNVSEFETHSDPHYRDHPDLFLTLY